MTVTEARSESRGIDAAPLVVKRGITQSTRRICLRLMDR